MSHLPPRVQQSDCLSAEERGLRGGIPSLWKEVQVGAEQEEEEEEENGEWDDSWRREICSFIRVGQAGQLLPLTSRTSERPAPSRTKGLLFLFPLAAFLPLPLPLLFFFFHTFSLIATLQDQDMTWRNKVLQVCKGKKKSTVMWCLWAWNTADLHVFVSQNQLWIFSLYWWLTDDGVGWMESTFPKQSTRWYIIETFYC